MTRVSRRWVMPGIATGGLFFLFAIGVVIFTPDSNHHVSDGALIANFQSQRQNFEKLIRMANEDTKVRSLYDDMVMFNDYQRWPQDGPNRFSSQRWEEYQAVFKALGSAEHQLEKESLVILIPASVKTTDLDEDYGEYRVSVKGYAYSRVPLSDEGPLDSLGVDDLGRTYRKIADHWYLYHDGGTGKPE